MARRISDAVGEWSDPGHHNRDAFIWSTRGGHYGHEHVPQNVHWDPAYSEAEVVYLMGDADDPEGHAGAATPTS